MYSTSHKSSFCPYIFNYVKECPIFTDELYTENLISITNGYNDINFKIFISMKNNNIEDIFHTLKNLTPNIHTGGGNHFKTNSNIEENIFVIQLSEPIHYIENDSDIIYNTVQLQIRDILNKIYDYDKEIKFGISLNKSGTLFTGHGNIEDFLFN